jgi:hypothetical protein
MTLPGLTVNAGGLFTYIMVDSVPFDKLIPQSFLGLTSILPVVYKSVVITALLEPDIQLFPVDVELPTFQF